MMVPTAPALAWLEPSTRFLAVDSGITGHAVAAALGHESFEKTTAGSYVQPGAVACHQHEVVTAVGETVGIDGAHSRGSAGDEDDRSQAH